MLEIKRERINNSTYRNVMVFAGLAHKHLSNVSGYRVQIIDDEDSLRVVILCSFGNLDIKAGIRTSGLFPANFFEYSRLGVHLLDDEDRRIIQRVQAVMDDLTHEWASLCVDEN